MIKELMQKNAIKAKDQLMKEIDSQKTYIKVKEEAFYDSLLINATHYSIREQATFLATCRATLVELEDILFVLEKEFPSLPTYEELAAEYADLDSCNWKGDGRLGSIGRKLAEEEWLELGEEEL
jgi:hypothetical protein